MAHQITIKEIVNGVEITETIDFNLLIFGVSTVHGSNITGQIGFGYTTVFEESEATKTFTRIINN